MTECTVRIAALVFVTHEKTTEAMKEVTEGTAHIAALVLVAHNAQQMRNSASSCSSTIACVAAPRCERSTSEAAEDARVRVRSASRAGEANMALWPLTRSCILAALCTCALHRDAVKRGGESNALGNGLEVTKSCALALPLAVGTQLVCTLRRAAAEGCPHARVAR